MVTVIALQFLRVHTCGGKERKEVELLYIVHEAGEQQEVVGTIQVHYMYMEEQSIAY